MKKMFLAAALAASVCVPVYASHYENSGESVFDACSFYKIPPENVIIVYDDISLPTGSVRIREKGSAGGHNGIKSIIYQLNSDNFPRIKLGVGAPKHKDYDLKDYVLGRFGKDEIETLREIIMSVPDIIGAIIKEGAAKAQNKYNKTVKLKKEEN